MTNRVVERMNDLGDKARERRIESRMDKMDRENERLRGEVKILRDDLHEERGSLQQALEALQKRPEPVPKTVKVVKKPRRTTRVVRTAIIGGGAYLLGTRAGRERYDQIMERVRSVKGDMQDRVGQRPTDGGWDSDSSLPSTGATGTGTTGIDSPS